MSVAIKMQLQKPQSVTLEGTAGDIGCDLAEHLLKGPIEAATAAFPLTEHRMLMLGFLTTLAGMMTSVLGRQEAGELLSAMAKTVADMPEDLAAQFCDPSSGRWQ